jgi:hypothetical protein
MLLSFAYLAFSAVLAGQVGARQHLWFRLTDDMLDLEGGSLQITGDLAKNRGEHRIFLTPIEVALFREQLIARARDTSLVFATVTGKEWTRSGFRGRVLATLSEGSRQA